MEFQEQQGIYQQIANHLCEDILRGIWPVNSRVPSVRELGAQLSVNPNTIMRSYSQLEETGILYNRRGIGFFVHGQARRRIIERKRSEFLARELPRFFRQMVLLNVSLDEVKSKFEVFLEQQEPPAAS